MFTFSAVLTPAGIAEVIEQAIIIALLVVLVVRTGSHR